jgi:hypothetical protein
MKGVIDRACGAEEAGIGDDADRTWMLGVGVLQSQDDVEEQPVAIEERLLGACVVAYLSRLFRIVRSEGNRKGRMDRVR